MKTLGQIAPQAPHLSDCCAAPTRVAGGKEGTNWYECTKCGKPCDVIQVELRKSRRRKKVDGPDWSF